LSGGLNLGGSVELVHNPIEVTELAMEKGAGMVLLPSPAAAPSSTCPTTWQRGSSRCSISMPQTRYGRR
jgi:predicted ATP-dependent Lon-type protease